MDWSNFFTSVAIGAVCGFLGGFQWWWSPWERRKRKRRMRAFRRMLAARTALAHEDHLSALLHLNDAIALECGEEVLPFGKYMMPSWIDED